MRIIAIYVHIMRHKKQIRNPNQFNSICTRVQQIRMICETKELVETNVNAQAKEFPVYTTQLEL